MKSYLALAAFLLLSVRPALAQTAAAPRYMQIFYEGAGWLAGRPLLHYSPALHGKTDEVVPEDSTKVLSPGALLFKEPLTSGAIYTTTASKVTTTSSDGRITTSVRDKNGQMRLETATDRQQERLREKASFDRQLNLLAARGALARNALTAALNDAAADGWEVVQVASWGSKDGLVYLLRHR